MTETNSPVVVHIENRVARVQLNREDKLNALDIATFEQLIDAQITIAKDASIRAVILHGAGRAFCAGLDMSVLTHAEALTDLRRRSHGNCNLFQQAALGWAELGVPVIAAVHGHCLGGGLQIALAADFRIAADNAKFSIMEINWGLVPDMGLTVTAPPLIRMDHLKEMVFTGRTVDSHQALDLGLVTRVVTDPLAEAFSLATTIAAKSPESMAASKRLLTSSTGAVANQLQAESSAMQELIGSHNQLEAVKARMQNRTPVFKTPNQ